jgi:hypothetical protein
LTPEEIKDLLTNPDPQMPSHHQVDPRIIKAYLTGECSNLSSKRSPSHYYSSILPAYLPRDQFQPSEQVEPLVNDQYRQDYHTWKNCLDANTRATKSLVDHLADPLYQVIEAPLSIPEPIFFHTVRAAELRWWNGYFNTYHSFNDLILFRGHYRYSYFMYPGTRVKVPRISTPRQWVYRLYDYLPTLTLTVLVQKKRIGYIKTSTGKSTVLTYDKYPLLTGQYHVETLDQIGN